MTPDAQPEMTARRAAVREEIRSRLGLPEWSNLRGDDVIMLVEGLDEASRARLNELFVELREIEDARSGLSGIGLMTTNPVREMKPR